MKLANKVVVVTGAGSGMGREIALELLRRRARVAAVDINETTLRETATLARGGADALSTHVLNITDRAAVEALPQAVVDRFGAVDGIINCAGIIQPFVRLNDLDYAAIDRVMDVNFRGTLYMTKTFLPWLLKRPGGAHRQRLEHGRLHAGARPDHLRGVQGGRQAADRGAPLGAQARPRCGSRSCSPVPSRPTSR